MKISTYQNIEIDVDDTGLFSAIINGDKLTARSMPDLKRKIAKHTKSIKVLVFHYSEIGQPTITDVIGEDNSNRLRDVHSGKLLQPYVDVFAYDESALAQISDIVEKHHELYREFNEIKSKLKVIR